MRKKFLILNPRKGKRSANRSNPLGLIGFLLAALISIAGGVTAIYGVNRYAEITEDLPAPEALPALLDPVTGPLLEPTRITDQDARVELWQFSNPSVPVRRYSAITDGDTFFYSNLPEELVLATIASQDPEYLERSEAFFPNLLDAAADPIPEGLVKDLLLWEDDTDYQDIRVRLLADQITARYGRKKVLEWVLNSTYYGNMLYGAAQAAEFYFDKDLTDLSLEESALLAAVGRYPALNPLDAPRAARENQAALLDEMAQAGFITDSQAAAAARKQLIFSNPDPGILSSQPAYVELILEEASQTIPRERLLRGGFSLVSTLDWQLQAELDCTLAIFSSRIVGSESPPVTDCQAGRLLPVYQGSELPETSSLELNLGILDPVSGELRGLAGKNTADQNLTIEQPRPPGSLITPFIYINAFTQGYEPASLVWDIPLEDSSLDVGLLHPGCSQDCQFLGPVNIRTALVNDLLSPARQFVQSQGGSQLSNTLELFGFSIQPGRCQNCQIFPEGSPVALTDLLQGFGVFVNQGYLTGRPVGSSNLQIQPAVLARIEDLNGIEYPQREPLVEKKIVSEELAFLINNTLSDQEAWLDSRSREFYRIGRPAGVKLGYVPGGQSGWTVGYTPRLVVGAWAGVSEPQVLEGTTPVDITSSLWRAVTQYISQMDDSQDWELPPGIITRDVCFPSGALPTQNCPRIVREVFITGYEPLAADTLYQAFQINRETGRLATVFTPPEQIAEKVYLNVPPQAADWAAESGIETPPTLYDLGDPGSGSSELELIAPSNLSFVRGTVWITGTIPEEDFFSARLQYGPGLNPRSWLQIGEEINSPVNSGYLGSWDTSGLEEGIYALQLVVIKEDQDIEKASLLVSVDNTAPEIILITDLSGGTVSYQAGKELLLEVDFANGSEIEGVDFYLDGSLLAARRVPPFLTPWVMSLGDHSLRIVAADQAGNRSELEIEFEVVRDD